jgi:hypothetical protein
MQHNTVKFYMVPDYWLLLEPKYLPQHPIFEHPQPVFFPSGDTSSFTPIKNNRQEYSSVHFHV